MADDQIKRNPIKIKSVDTAVKVNEPKSDIEVIAREAIKALSKDNLMPTPSNYNLYFYRILEDKSEALRQQINSVLEFEQDSGDEKSQVLESSLKEGFSSVKNVLGVTSNLYKNMSHMTKLLEKRQEELKNSPEASKVAIIIKNLTDDTKKLNVIVHKQLENIKEVHNSTAEIIKSVDSETIFDSEYDMYNKRYLIKRLAQELIAIQEFKHKSIFMLIELNRDIASAQSSEKVRFLMNRTVGRLILKTSRRNDIIGYYGKGAFAMILKHSDITSAEKTSDRLVELVKSTNFFLEDQEIRLGINIGIAELNASKTVEENIVDALDALDSAFKDSDKDYFVSGK
jgi:diguanylate cyclase (GGDEF)-like protein